ncbi:type II toxin-antitoxin system RelE/ParE family toxin [Sulfurimonas sp.]|uniref:type II toxin-antitoxin system RelE/ParE family toxin n=1 Tax=Sulfurimonas sp. TaxID=2022749 RepID=UPI002AAF7593|nr:type II toxin-antitoxin system RelE/ParE family toxin [Sulfurimonas sp.]
MIKSFIHKGLQKFYENGMTKGVQSEHIKKIKMRLLALDTALIIEDLALPGFNLHKLKGNRAEIYSIKVSGNWRITFRFEDGDVEIVNYEDYH